VDYLAFGISILGILIIIGALVGLQKYCDWQDRHRDLNRVRLREALKNLDTMDEAVQNHVKQGTHLSKSDLERANRVHREMERVKRVMKETSTRKEGKGK